MVGMDAPIFSLRNCAQEEKIKSEDIRIVLYIIFVFFIIFSVPPDIILYMEFHPDIQYKHLYFQDLQAHEEFHHQMSSKDK